MNLTGERNSSLTKKVKKEKAISAPEATVGEGASHNWFERNPKKTIIFILLFLCLFIIYGAEIYLRLTSENLDNYDSGLKRYIVLREPQPLQVTNNTPTKRYLTLTDGLEKKNYVMRIDENGFIMPSKRYDNPDVTLAFLGSSTTECGFVDEEKRFPYLTGKLLEKKLDLKINSYNAAAHGNNSIHSLNILLNKVLPLNPDVVIMKHNISDLRILMSTGTYWSTGSGDSPIVVTSTNSFSARSFFRSIKNMLIPNLYAKVKQFADRFSDNDTPIIPVGKGGSVKIDKARILKEFKMNLRTFVSICESRGITPVLMTQANRYTDAPDKIVVDSLKRLKEYYGFEYSDFKALADAFNEAVRQVALESEIKLIDLAAEVPQTNEYLYDSTHLNNNGSELSAEIIARELVGLVEIPGE